MRDLAVIIVSTNEAQWLPPCLTSVFEHAGTAELEVVVVDNQSTDGTSDLVERDFPSVRVVTCPNRGFSHANNRGIMTCDARYALFLNPDTEILDGTFGALVDAMDRQPQVGLIGVRQLGSNGELLPTIRRFPSGIRAFAEAFGAERLPLWHTRLGERELDSAEYGRERECDWTSGSFMLARREALLSSGLLDERFFIYSEEPDLCLRMKRAGWEIRHLPLMTILHHVDKAGINPRMVAQDAYARLQYARKHFSTPRRCAYLAGVFARHAIRSCVGDRARRMGARRALITLLGRTPPPFGPPPGTALRADHAPVVSTNGQAKAPASERSQV